MEQWLEHGALPMSLPAVWFRIPLGAGLSDKYHISPLSILRHYFDVVSLAKHFTIILCFNWLRCKWVPGRTEMAMCATSSYGRNGCKCCIFKKRGLKWYMNEQVLWPGVSVKRTEHCMCPLCIRKKYFVKEFESNRYKVSNRWCTGYICNI